MAFKSVLIEKLIEFYLHFNDKANYENIPLLFNFNRMGLNCQ